MPLPQGDGHPHPAGPAPAAPATDDAYHSVFADHPHPMFVYEPATLRILDVNDSACTLYGWARGELLSMTILDIRPDEDIPSLLKFVEEQRDVATRRSQARHRKKDGTIMEVDVTSKEVRFGNISARVALVDDVTESNRLRRRLEQSEQRYRALVANSYDSVMLSDRDGNVLYSSPSTVSVLGFTETELAGQNSFERVHPDDLDRVSNEWAQMVAVAGSTYVTEYRVRNRRGEWPWLEATCTNLLEEPAVGAVVINYRDVTDRKMAELALRESEDRLRTIAETAGEWIWTVDRRGVLHFSSRAVEAILGYKPEEVVGRSCFKFFTPDDAAAARRNFEQSAHEQSGWANQVKRLVHRDGSERFVESTAVPVRDDTGQLTGFRGVDRDITDRKIFEMKISHQAFHDGLTDLPNRRLFTDRLSVALARAPRSGNSVAVLFVDLDHFKLINDNLGHAFGDEVLKTVAERLRANVRAADSVARVGGDEFLIVVSDITDANDAASVARKIVESLSPPIEVDGHRLFVSASIGISLSPGDGDTPETLIRNADNAMYRAKETGRNAIQLFHPEMNERYANRIALETSLREAIERQQFVLHYQPIYDCRSGALSGVEALIRWNHPVAGLLQPETFIDVAEQARMILPIGAWALDTACRDLRRWTDHGHTGIRVSVNLSARQIQQGDLIEIVEGAVNKAGIDPARLELEITESVAMHDAPLTLETLHGLKRMGLSLAVDDFGTGFSSLLYLTRFPIDTLKIDRGFVRDLSIDANDTAVVAAILALASSLRLRTVAEGVESGEQLEFLKSHRCTEVQGFFLAPPMPADEIEHLLGGNGGGKEQVAGGVGSLTP